MNTQRTIITPNNPEITLSRDMEKKFSQVFQTCYSRKIPSRSIPLVFQRITSRLSVPSSILALHLFPELREREDWYAVAAECFGFALHTKTNEVLDITNATGWCTVSINPSSQLDLSRVYFTDNALKRFIATYGRTKNAKKPILIALEFLSYATEQKKILHTKHIVNMAANDFNPVRYFSYQRWWFVVQEKKQNIFEVITFEERTRWRG